METLIYSSLVEGDGHIIIADFEEGIDLIDLFVIFNFDDFDHMMDHYITPTTSGGIIHIDYEDTMIDIYGIDPSAGGFSYLNSRINTRHGVREGAVAI